MSKMKIGPLVETKQQRFTITIPLVFTPCSKDIIFSFGLTLFLFSRLFQSNVKENSHFLVKKSRKAIRNNSKCEFYDHRKIRRVQTNVINFLPVWINKFVSYHTITRIPSSLFPIYVSVCPDNKFTSYSSLIKMSNYWRTFSVEKSACNAMLYDLYLYCARLSNNQTSSLDGKIFGQNAIAIKDYLAEILNLIHQAESDPYQEDQNEVHTDQISNVVQISSPNSISSDSDHSNHSSHAKHISMNTTKSATSAELISCQCVANRHQTTTTSRPL